MNFPKSETARPKIMIIYTGGTIGMIENRETGALQPLTSRILLIMCQR